MSESVLIHMLYELDKGIRYLALITVESENVDIFLQIISQRGYSMFMQRLTHNTNIYFGSEATINVIKIIADKKLSETTPEEDFIIGACLGYDINK